MTLVDDYFNEPIFYGGAICTRAEAIADMEESGLDQRSIDRWLQGAELAAERGLGLPFTGDESGEWEPVGITAKASAGL